MSRQRIRQLRAGDPVPAGEPRRYVEGRGYVRLRWRIGPNEYVECYEHRFLSGIPAGRHVHHRNELKGDNAPENLAILTPREHLQEHHEMDDGAISALYSSGMSTPEIANRLGTGPSAVRQSLRRSGTPLRSLSESKKAKLNEDEVARRLMAGERPESIGRSLGVSATPVRRIQRERGLPSHRSGNPGRRARQLDILRSRWHVVEAS